MSTIVVMKQNHYFQNDQSIGEEIANSALHGIGGFLGIFGLVLLVNHAKSSLPALVIFASAMILMFFVSTVYHVLPVQKIKKLFQIFDHQAIYIFIAGTYTPFCLLALKGPLGIALLCFEWALALTGVILSALSFNKIKKIEMIIYILMGWAIIIGCIPLAGALPVQSYLLLFAGGLAYTAGTFWYRAGKDKPSKKRKRLFCGHVIWHLFVLAGAICHWFSIWFLCLNAG